MSKKNRQKQKRRKYWRKYNRGNSTFGRIKKQRGLWRKFKKYIRPLDILTSDWFYRQYMDKLNEDMINRSISQYMMGKVCLEGAKRLNNKVIDETIEILFERKMANYYEENGSKQENSWVKKGMIGLKSGLKWG